MAGEDEVSAHIQFKIDDRRVRMQFMIPSKPIRSRRLLPIMREITNFVVATAEEREVQAGRTISCTAGCGACCRQLVPIAPSEAHELAAAVDAMPLPRREEVRRRFNEATERFTHVGMIGDLRRLDRVVGEQVAPFGLRYFEVGVACPFLEDESCSIHADRPLACREYLVTSAAHHCAEPATEQVEGVPLSAKVSRILRRMDQGDDAETAPTIPLILALEWAALHVDESPARPGPELVREFIERLTGEK